MSWKPPPPPPPPSQRVPPPRPGATRQRPDLQQQIAHPSAARPPPPMYNNNASYGYATDASPSPQHRNYGYMYSSPPPPPPVSAPPRMSNLTPSAPRPYPPTHPNTRPGVIIPPSTANASQYPYPSPQPPPLRNGMPAVAPLQAPHSAGGNYKQSYSIPKPPSRPTYPSAATAASASALKSAPPSHRITPPPAPSYSSTRIDPSKLPQVRNPCAHPDRMDVFYPKATLKHTQDATPPPADSRHIVLDDGNASPMLLRSTLSVIPRDRALLANVGQDMAVLVTPLALASADWDPCMRKYADDKLPSSGRLAQIPMELGSNPTSPPRCTRCHAYFNPYWEQNRCNFCEARSGFHQGMGSSVSTVEYRVAGPYITRSAPVQPNLIYAIDVGMTNCLQVISLLLNQVLPQWFQLAQHHQQDQKQRDTRVGIVLVDGNSGIYLPRKDASGWDVMPDMAQEPFCPLPLVDWTWSTSNSQEYAAMLEFWNQCLQTTVPKLVSTLSPMRSSVGGASFAFLVDALKPSGGRGVWIAHHRPRMGVGSLLNRERQQTKKAHATAFASVTTVAPTSDSAQFYAKLSETATSNCVALDAVLLRPPTSDFLDVATLSHVCAATNGNFTWIATSISGRGWISQIREALSRPMEQFGGWDAVLKLRCSAGLRVKSLVTGGVGVTRQSTGINDESPELDMAVVSPDTCVGVELEHRVGGTPKSSQLGFIQSALLYTNPWTGDRRVRVSTLALKLSNSPAEVFRGMDFSAICAWELRSILEQRNLHAPPNETNRKPPLPRAQESLETKAMNLFRKYRESAAGASFSHSQLVLPEKLQQLPLFVMSVRKSTMLCPSIAPREYSGILTSPASMPTPRSDERAYAMHFGRRCLPANAFWMVDPLLLQVPEDASAWPWRNTTKVSGTVVDELKRSPYVDLGKALPPTISNLKDDQVYLMDCMFQIYLLVGKDVSPGRRSEMEHVLEEYLGSQDSDGPPEHQVEASGDHPLIRGLVQLRLWTQVGKEPLWLRPVHPPVVLLSAESASWNAVLQQHLVCDGGSQEKEYSDYLQFLHQGVRMLK